MKYVYNKLVRDRIPEEIDKSEGRKSNYRILDDEEYLKELDRKLFEEAHEFVEEHSLEELADLMEVLSAIMKLKGMLPSDVESARMIKNNKKGGFDKKIYPIDVEQNQIDEREEKESKKEWRKADKTDSNNSIENLQELVSNMVATYDLDISPELRYIDLTSEVGEIGKEFLKGSDYGKNNYRKTDNMESEIGDTLFSLICIANSLNIDLRTALMNVMVKYQKRFAEKGNVGSEC